MAIPMEPHFHPPIFIGVDFLAFRAGYYRGLDTLNNRLWSQARRSELICGFYDSKGAMITLTHVTGGSGFIGTHVVDALLDAGCSVRVLDPKAPHRADAEWVPVDVLDTEYRADGIRANAILPSVIDTPANRAAMPDADFSRWVRPEEIGNVIAFLCSDKSSALTGAHVPVYGQA